MEFLAILKVVGLFFLGLSLLVFIHEMGHFVPAKLFGIRADKFYLFFDWPRKIWSFRWKGTEYGIGMLPFGGYVRIQGMVDESALDKKHLEAQKLSQAPEHWEFRAKPVWQRFIVMVGGVAMNVLLAWVIFTMLVYSGGERRRPVASYINGISVVPGSLADSLGLETGDKLVAVNGTSPQYIEDYVSSDVLLRDGSYYVVERNGRQVRIDIPPDFINQMIDAGKRPGGELLAPNFSTRVNLPDEFLEAMGGTTNAQKAGLKDGDRVVAVNGTPVATFWEMRELVVPHKSDTVQLLALRGADTLAFAVPTDTAGRIGLAPDPFEYGVDTIRYGFLAAWGRGWQKSWQTVGDNILGLRKIFRGEADASKSVSGPVQMAMLFGRIDFWPLVAMLSMVLAFMNILPIPALDGGHIVFLLIEAVTRREPSLKTRLWAQQIGMFLLIGLMVLVFMNDIRRIIME